MKTISGPKGVLLLIALLGPLTILTPVLRGWGHEPHGHIVEAALAALTGGGRLPGWLADAGKLRFFVMLGDWRDCFIAMDEQWATPREGTSLPGFQMYSNDFLIFPQAPRHYNHSAPDLPMTYGPFFTRVLQALRTESPSNAVRWTGSLLHFVTDSGAPPHAAGIKGDAHTKMENWLDGSKIDLRGYKPVLLGETDEEAQAGFLRRMAGLTQFSTVRARRLTPLVAADDRARCEPIVLESAAETARVAADTLHTLLVLSGRGKAGGELHGQLTAPTAAAVHVLPAKLILLDTSYSTTSETVVSRHGSYHGVFTLRNLPPGTYRATVYRVGAKPADRKVEIKAGARTEVNWTLEPETPAGNLVRNPDFQIRWTSKNAPEHWRYNASRNWWVSDNIKVEPGRSYQAGAAFKAPGRVSMQWMRHHVFPLEKGDIDVSKPLRVVAPEGAVYAQFLVHGKGQPSDALNSVHFVQEEGRR